MAEQIDSGYGFVYVDHVANDHFVDIYIPVYMLRLVQLLPGSTVLAKGLRSAKPSRLQLRPSKGGDNVHLGTHRFLASIRFPNRPGTMKRFLSTCTDLGIRFASIRTQGSRGEAMSDAMFEGGLDTIADDFELGKAIGIQLATAATQAQGDVISTYPTHYTNVESGIVLSSSYVLDVPLLRGAYGKIRFTTHGKDRPFEKLHRKLVLARLQLDVARMTLTVDLTLTSNELHTYVLFFETTGLPSGTPITQTILEALPDNVNVDAVDAFEYLEYDPTVMADRTEKRVGVIEMLLTTPSTLSADSSVDQIQTALKSHPWGDKPFDLAIVDLPSQLASRSLDSVPEDTHCTAFRKLLRNGRYAFVERIGDGGFGLVNKYLDLETGTLVAGKHIRHVDTFNVAEIRALSRAAEIKTSRHLVMIHDCFYDGTIPVMIMEFMESTLADHLSYPRRDSARRVPTHTIPATFAEVIDMAEQLLKGLETLHFGEIERFVHADVKPENIGFARVGRDALWKLLDFGLSRPLPLDGGPTPASRVAGSTPYMSPQTFLRQRWACNDIYSLGICLFEILNDWRHPGTIQKSGMVEEVESYYRACQQGLKPKHLGFSKTRWALGAPFNAQHLEPPATDQLRDIVYQMMAFDLEARFQTASEVSQAFHRWKQSWLT